MQENYEHIARIIVKHAQETCTEAELLELNRWANSNPRNQLLLNDLLDKEKIKKRLLILKSIDENSSWERVVNQGSSPSVRKRQNLWKPAIVAAAILVFGTISYWYYKNSVQPLSSVHYSRIVESSHPKYKNDILPAVEGATLITAEGKKIGLSEAITVYEDGTVLNESNKAVTNLNQFDTIEYNELVVPQTRYFSFRLSDGTKVWVNANSRLSFPSRFTDEERKIRLLEGEAYFEVAERQNHPFIVETSRANVRVLGTHFNVKNYNNNFSTTLAEGSVQVYNQSHQKKLSPNQKAYFKSGELITRTADLTKELSWKNNVFYFNKDDIRSVMTQIENWYGVKVYLDRSVANNATYSGEIKRDVPLSKMLDMLEFTSGLDFILDDTKLYIKQKRSNNT